MAKKPTTQGTDRQAKIEAARKTQGRGANTIVVAAVVVIVAIVAVVGGVVWSSQRSDDQAKAAQKAPAGASMGKPYRAYADVTPKQGAPTLDVYEDFQCPACAQFEAAMAPTIEKAAKEGRVIVQYHVLNFLDDKTGASYSTPIANGAFCAAEKGKFQEFHDAAYKGQTAEGQDVSIATIRGFAQQAGLAGEELTAWETCTTQAPYTDYVNSVDKEAFEVAKIGGTPSLRLNGTDLPTRDLVNDAGNALDPAKLDAAIAAATK